MIIYDPGRTVTLLPQSLSLQRGQPDAVGDGPGRAAGPAGGGELPDRRAQSEAQARRGENRDGPESRVSLTQRRSRRGTSPGPGPPGP